MRKRPQQPRHGSSTVLTLHLLHLIHWHIINIIPFLLCREKPTFTHKRLRDLHTRHHFRANFRYEHCGEAPEQHMKGREHQKAVVFQNNLKAEETETVNQLRYLSYSCVCVLILAYEHM